jgi:DNA-binding transcriptional LysR family regulator
MSKEHFGPAIEPPPADITVHQLEIFRTVASCLSYTRAAEQLYLSQPAVTQQMRALERQLGCALFVRRGRGIVLSPAGQELLPRVERLLSLLAETETIVREIRTLQRGSVSLGASISAGTYVLPSLLSSFHQRFPRIQVTLVVGNRREIEERLIRRELDLAVISLIEHPERFVIEPLRPYELILIAPPSHRLAGRRAIPLTELQQETFLLREPESATRLASEQLFRAAGISPQGNLELGNIEALKEGVVSGLGLAVILREAVALELASGELVTLDVEGFPLRRQWCLVQVAGRRLSLAARALGEELRRCCTGYRGSNGWS